MAYLKPQDYKGQTNKYTYPKEVDPKKKKSKDYYKAVCEAMMADYASGLCQLPLEFAQDRSISELRAYRKGKQGSEKIKKWILGNKKQDKSGREVYITKMNISWDVFQKLPQMFDQMRAKNMSQEYDVELNCIDDDSVAARQGTAAMLKYIINEETKKFLEKSSYKINFEINPEELGLQTNDDIDMYMETGGFMLQREIGAKAACKKTKIASNYNMLQDELFDDILTNPEGLTGVKVYIDESTQIPTIRKVDIENAIIQFSKRPDHSDNVRAGEIRVMNIGDIRKECPWMSEAAIRDLAKKFAWMNPDYDKFMQGQGGYFAGLKTQTDNTANGFASDPVNRVKILVLDAQWLSDDIETRLTNQFPNGGKVYKEVDFDYKPDVKSVNKGDRVIKKNVIKKYFAKWIIGTDYFLDCGIDKGNVYYGEEGNRLPRLDYFFVKTGNSSMVERCIAIVDDINMILIKHRNAWSTLPAAPAMAIQKHLVENVFLNDKRQSPMDLIQGLIERGVFYYDALDDHGDPKFSAGGQKPVEFMDVTKMAGMLTICSNEMLVKVNELREVLGLQGGADGGQTSPYQGLGQTRLAFEAANASLMPAFKVFHYLFKGMFDHCIKQWQIVAQRKKTKVVASSLGSKNLKVLELSKDFSNAEFNTEVTIAPTIEERQALLQELAGLKTLGNSTNGQQGLTYSEYIFLYDKIMAGNITEAMFIMAKIERKKQLRADALQRQAQQDNLKANAASAQEKGKAELESQKAKSQSDMNTTLISELSKTNRELMKIIASGSSGSSENTSDKVFAASQIQNNNEDIANIMEEAREPEMTPEQEEAMMMQGNVPMM